MTNKRQCTSTTKSGRPCRAWAVRGSDPPRCVGHGAAVRGARPLPPAESSTFSEAPDPVEQAIAGLADTMRRLETLIEAHEGPNGYLIRLFGLYGQACSRMGRLVRDRAALHAAAQGSSQPGVPSGVPGVADNGYPSGVPLESLSPDDLARGLLQALDEVSGDVGTSL
jgi:hypothetical protein